MSEPLPDFYAELVERIRARLVPDPERPGCLVFPQKPGRHTRINFGGKLYSPHRVICEWEAGRLLGQLDACHRCDNPPCCNPAHLFPGTRAENLLDAVAKGRVSPPCPERLLTDPVVQLARLLHEGGMSTRALGAFLGVSRNTAWRAVTLNSDRPGNDNAHTGTTPRLGGRS